MTMKPFLFGAFVITACTFLNVLLGLRIIDTTSGKRDPAWIRVVVVNQQPLHQVVEELVDDEPGDGDPTGMIRRRSNPNVAVQTKKSEENALDDGRFPTYGTASFASKCQWTMAHTVTNSTRNCTILARPPTDGGEGVSNWFSQIVTAHILAQQLGCKLYLDYGPDIDIHQVLMPHTNHEQHHPSAVDWRVPDGFDCDLDPECLIAAPQYDDKKLQSISIATTAAITAKNLTAIPCYRHAYKLSRDYFQRMGGFQDLERRLNGFTLETGFSCSLTSLLQLAPSASRFEPRLFSNILPALNAPDTLVLSVYIRTGQTEHVGSRLSVGFQKRAQPILDCALQVEKEYLLSSRQQSWKRVVWMLVTDAPKAKQWVTAKYNSRHSAATAAAATNASTLSIPREIVTTRSRGAHTKTQLKPSVADFAEAFIDWYLIGESDLVVTDDFAPSFGDTGALRTGRPYYKLQGHPRMCSKATQVIK